MTTPEKVEAYKYYWIEDPDYELGASEGPFATKKEANCVKVLLDCPIIHAGGVCYKNAYYDHFNHKVREYPDSNFEISVVLSTELLECETVDSWLETCSYLSVDDETSVDSE